MEIIHQRLKKCDISDCQENAYGQSFSCLKCVKRSERCIFCRRHTNRKICLACCIGFKEWLSSNFSIDLELVKYYMFRQFDCEYCGVLMEWRGFYAGEKWVKFDLDKESFDSEGINKENCVERITDILESNGIYLEREIQCDISSLSKSARKIV